jgi:hypothetical protein
MQQLIVSSFDFCLPASRVADSRRILARHFVKGLDALHI